jgi:uncharacterized BrkB/YihY/UPF0761 family membrane protein
MATLPLEQTVWKILSVGGIAGVIAIAITITICYRYAMNGPEEIPQILTYSLTTIIGFYFGTGVARGGSAEPLEKSN